MRRPLHWAALGVVLSAALGCSGDDAPASRVGSPCASAAECGAGETCLAGTPGGLCVRPCAVSGTTEECGAGAVCERDNFPAGDGGTVEMTVCIQMCERTEECRDGYTCHGTGGSSIRGCHPE